MLGEFFSNVKDWLAGFLNEVQKVVLEALPDSPFKDFVLPLGVQNILSYINWIVPFYMIGNTLLAWTVAIGVYYAYQIILRWLKSIQ